MSDIELKLRCIIGEITENKEAASALGLEENLNVTVLNSINFVKVVVAIESEFNIEFEDEDLDMNNFENFQKLISYIEEKL
ncbi:acyl carrier protein [Paenibacillus amylolyticus]|uniref:acyl carrier protein n=1 Tax=Paenibacillus amylolyticus TaxID=1451 RepID=UPI003EB7E138